MLRYFLLLTALILMALPAVQGAPSRDISAMTKWAEQQGIVMHDSLQWKQYDPDGDSNWGLELKESVPAGTTLLQVPRKVVLDANCIHQEFKDLYGDAKLQRALKALGDFGMHKDGFFIFLKLLRCSRESDSKWSPWIQGLPKEFPQFSQAEIDCLPFYAKYAAEYQEKKFQAFCQAAAELGEWNKSDPHEKEKLKWAFHAVGSRFWKTEPLTKDDEPNTELVPVGDMFNHREPPNVAVTHEGDFVNFVYKGDADENNKDLYITYGQPSNAHRFLVMFGFVPTDMPQVWSQLAYPNNPFSANVPKMVFQVKDGTVPKVVWDAVLLALLQPPAGEKPVYTKEQHEKYKKFTLDVLKTHVSKELDELAQLRQKIETTNGDNMALIRAHNEFLTTVFSRVQAHLQSDDDKACSS